MERNVGTMAVILVPTRELATQIFDTAQALLDYRSPRVEGGEGVTRVSTRWIAPGLLVGGQHRQHEKAKLRKGIPLLIATVRPHLPH